MPSLARPTGLSLAKLGWPNGPAILLLLLLHIVEVQHVAYRRHGVSDAWLLHHNRIVCLEYLSFREPAPPVRDTFFTPRNAIEQHNGRDIVSTLLPHLLLELAAALDCVYCVL